MGLLNASPLALPDQAGIEQAWQEAIDPPNPPLGTRFVRVTPGETYEQLLTAHFSLHTEVAAGNRTPQVVIQDPNGVNVVVVSPPSSQPGSSDFGYTVDGSGHLQYTLPQGGAVIGMPPVLLLPGYSLIITWSNQAANDQLQSIGIVMLRIPTRPPQPPAPILAATPLAV